MATATKIHAIHEAGHSLVAHVCGLKIRSAKINTSTQSGTDVDRGYDPTAAEQEIRGTATDNRICELLPRLKRDLAVAIGGIAAEQLHAVYTSGDPANREDEKRAELLASTISLAQWKITNPRPEFSDREKPQAYRSRMQSFVEQLAKTRASALSALADQLELAISISGDEAHRILEENGAPFGSISDSVP